MKPVPLYTQASRWRHMKVRHLKTPTTRPLVQYILPVNNVENINLFITGPLWEGWFPLTKGQWCGRRFHVMTSSLDTNIYWFVKSDWQMYEKTVVMMRGKAHQIWNILAACLKEILYIHALMRETVILFLCERTQSRYLACNSHSLIILRSDTAYVLLHKQVLPFVLRYGVQTPTAMSTNQVELELEIVYLT